MRVDQVNVRAECNAVNVGQFSLCCISKNRAGGGEGGGEGGEHTAVLQLRLRHTNKKKDMQTIKPENVSGTKQI